ncbi:DUF2510 domain-containing protein [Nocardioides marinus]
MPETPHDAPRQDAAAPAWYPDPHHPGALRYWNGADWTEGTATPGWYPHPEHRAPLRYWTGSAWGGELAGTAGVVSATAPTVGPVRWVGLPVAAALVGLAVGAGSALAVTLGGSNPTSAGTPTTTATATAATEPTSPVGPAAAPDPSERTPVRVARVLSSRSVLLDDGRRLRLLGLGPTPCDTNRDGKKWLDRAAAGREIALTVLADPSTDELGGYLDVDGADLGEQMISAGLAVAAVGHPRAPRYAAAARGVVPCS